MSPFPDDPLQTRARGAFNYQKIIDKNPIVKHWVTPGVYRWQAPDDVRRIYFRGVAAGAGGARSALTTQGGGGGGGGESAIGFLDVIPGEYYTVTVGTGGLGLPLFPSGSANGLPGTDTSFIGINQNVVLAHGNGGTSAGGGGLTAGANFVSVFGLTRIAGGAGGDGGDNSIDAHAGANADQQRGGALGGATTLLGGGGGGATGIAKGGDGGSAAGVNVASGTSPVNMNSGAGAGAAGASTSGTGEQLTAAGANGQVTIEFYTATESC